jgi:uncharacterized protein (DUF58 family)
MLQPGLSEERAGQVGAEQRKDRLTAERLRRELRGDRYVDQSRDTQFSASWVWLGIVLTIAGLALDSSFLLATAAALWVIAGASWGWNRLSLAGLHYERHLSETRAFLGEKIELTLTVRNRKPLPLTWLEITDAFPSALPFEGGEVVLNQASNVSEFPTFWTVGAWQRLTRRYTINCAQRGYHAFGPATVATGDGFGLFSQRATLPTQQRLIIYPRLYTVAELRLPAKNPFGERAARERLFEDPLRTVGIRDWQPADSLRRVHWKATARRQPLGGPMLSRLYEPSSEPQIVIFLNVATMPRHWQGNIPELLERAISVAGSLAAICAERRLPVGLVANGFLPGSDQPLRLLPGRSPNQLVRILELLAAITSFATGPIEELLLHEAPRLPWGSTLLVVTAIAHDGLLAALAELAEAGRPVVLFTLAEEAPAQEMAGVLVYHLPHLVDDLIAPAARS